MRESRIALTVVWFLGVSLILGLVGLIALAYFKLAVPEGLWTIVGGVEGALGAILATTRPHTLDSPQAVEVTNTPRNPVETHDADNDKDD